MANIRILKELSDKTLILIDNYHFAICETLELKEKNIKNNSRYPDKGLNVLAISSEIEEIKEEFPLFSDYGNY